MKDRRTGTDAARSSMGRQVPWILWVAATGLLLAGGALASPGHAGLAPVAPPLSVPTPTTNTSALDLGMALNASVDVSMITGGSNNASKWSFTWLGLPTNCTSQNVSNYTCYPTSTGTFSITVKVSDSGTSTNATSSAVSITVNTDPVLSSFTVSAPTVDVNGTLTFTASASGGTAPLSYVYFGLPSGCTGNTSVITCTPKTAQTYNVSVSVVDAVGMVSAATLNVSVKVTAASPAATSTGPTLVQWGIIAAILVIGLGISAALFVRAGREARRAYGTRPPGGASGGRPPSPPPSGGSPPTGPPSG